MSERNFSLNSRTFTLADANPIAFDALDFVYLLETTGTIQISHDGGGTWADLPLRTGIMGRHAWAGRPGSIGLVHLRNNTGGSVTFTIQTGHGATVDNRGGTSAAGTQNVAIVGATANVPTVGAVAHDAAVTGAPVQVAGEARSSERAAVANADVARLVTDLVGKLIVLPFANPENFVRGATAAIVDGTRTAVIAAPGAGVSLYVNTLVLTNTHATQDTAVVVEDDTTEILRVHLSAADDTAGSRTVTVHLPVPIKLTANKPLNVSCVTAGANVYAFAAGYKGA